MIKLVNISKTYGKKANAFKALSDVSFEIPEGSKVAVIGRSGSGKSTLMHIMSGLDTPDNGQVLIDNKDIIQFSDKQKDKFRSSTIGFIFQAFFVQGKESCYDNVCLPLEIAGVPLTKQKEKVELALKRVGLSDKLRQKAKNLSGGQKQRLAIARAIVNNPKVLFADEPTGNLDSKTGAMVERLLFAYNQKFGTTLVIVTHDVALAKKCDIMIHVADGKVKQVLYKRKSRTS